MANYQVHLTMKSRNAKVGPIPVSTTSAKTCPSDCPFKKSGCYADGGPLALFWSKVTSENAGTDWKSFCDQIEALPEGQLWRHNQAGDLPGNGLDIDWQAMVPLVNAARHTKGFTYTHYSPFHGSNADHIRAVNYTNSDPGLVVNLSGNNLHHADKLAALGIAPVVAVVPEDFPDRGETPEGRKVAVCPEQTGKAKSCAECGLCQKRDRAVIVAFRAHGVSKKKAIAIATA